MMPELKLPSRRVSDGNIVENEEMTEEEFNKRREGLLDGDCLCKG